MNRITVFTPTYNRAYCLHRCYESMLRQSCQEFDWLIIDDGSTDNTRALVESWMASKPPFPIRYIYKENGGMHTGYNTAYEHIDTELCFNVDSDDYLTDTAVEDILAFWDAHGRSDAGGIYALDQYEDGSVIGLPFPEDLTEFRGWGYKFIDYEAGGVKKRHVNQGDKKFIGVTRILKQYPPIPVFEGEKYHSLYYKQHLIERDYTMLILNKPVCVVEYMSDSSTNHMYRHYVNNPKGFCSERRFVMAHAPSRKLRFVTAVHYVAESFLAKDRHFLAHSTNKPATVLALPLGAALYVWIKVKTS